MWRTLHRSVSGNRGRNPIGSAASSGSILSACVSIGGVSLLTVKLWGPLLGVVDAAKVAPAALRMAEREEVVLADADLDRGPGGARVILCSIDGMGVGWRGPDTRTPLFKAIEHREPEEVKRLLAENVRVDLHAAAALGFGDTVRRLIDDEPAILNKMVNGRTPLAVAAGAGQTVVMANLMVAGADLEAGAPFLTPVGTAVHHGQADALKMLLDAGAKLPKKSEDAEIFLVLAVQSRSLRVVEQLSGAGMLEVTGNRRASAIHATSGYEICELLTRDFHDPQVLGDALYGAALAGKTDVAALLIARGADVEATPREGLWTPLHVAASEGHTAIINLLVDRGADVNRKDKKGYTPLDKAYLSKQLAGIRVLRGLGGQHGPAWDRLSRQTREELTPPGWDARVSPADVK